MQSGSHDHCRVDYTIFHQVDVLAGVGVEAFVLAFHVANAVHNNGSIVACVFGDAAEWVLQHVGDNAGTGIFVAFQTEFAECFAGSDQSDAAAWYDAFFQCGGCCALGVFQQIFPLLHFSFGDGTNVDLSHAAGQLGQTFLKFLTIVIAIGVFDLATDLVRAILNRLLVATAGNDDCLVGRDANFLGGTKIA